MCCHEIDSNKCTLNILPQRRMVYPPKFTAQCSECGQIFNNITLEDKKQIDNLTK